MPIERLILHLGIYKTGTSSIQRFLHAKRDDLAAASILYPRTGLPDDLTLLSPGQHVLARLTAEWDGTETHPFPPMVDALRAEFEASGCRDLVLSAEDLSSVERPENLAERLDAREVEIVVSLRPQHEIVSSLYYTAVAHRRMTAYPQEYLDAELRPFLDYHAMLVRWQAAFPRARLIVRLFDKGQPARKDSIADFVGQLGLPLTPPDDPRAFFEHQTLPAKGTIALRAAAEIGCQGVQFWDVFRLLHTCRDLLGREMSVFSPAQRRQIHEDCRATNRRIRRDFVDGADEDLFTEPAWDDEAWTRQFGDFRAVERDVLARFVAWARWMIQRQESDFTATFGRWLESGAAPRGE